MFRRVLIRLRFMPVLRRIWPAAPWALWGGGTDVPPPDLTPEVSADDSGLNPMRMLLFLWFLFIASAASWLPAYKGDLDGSGVMFVLVYALIAGLAAIGVRGRARSMRDALLSALPTVALLAVAAVGGDLQNEHMAQFRGEPLYLYFGVALWASWAALVLSTALVSRTKWNGLAGIGLGLLVAVLGLFLFTMRID